MIRHDHLVIAAMIKHKARVLDVGCGDGSLLNLLIDEKQVDGRGIELSREGVNSAVARGLAIIQGDADSDLVHYPNKAFDTVILSQTLQATQKPREVIENLLRIGETAIVSIPNFGYWRLRLQFILTGKMPRSDHLPYEWYNTPNIHFCTIRDFMDLVNELNVDVLEAVALDASGRSVGVKAPWWFWNMFGESAVFLLKKRV